VATPIAAESPGTGGTLLLFIRLLGLVYVVAFASLYFQVDGLLGPSGILPVGELLRAASGLGTARFWVLPTVFWLSTSSAALKGVCALGTAGGILLASGVAPLVTAPILWGLYLSLVSVGGVFLGYQWDNLLLETGLLAFVIAPPGLRPHPPFRVDFLPLLALRFLLFRLMFSSGIVKLLSGDPAWRSLSALGFHYETQPLPTWVGWYFWALPRAFHVVSAALMFVIEIGTPFFIFGGRRLRLLALLPILFLQILIALTGNYGFFNWLTIALLVLLLDDGFLPERLRGKGEAPSEGRTVRFLRKGGALFLMVVSLVPFLEGFGVRVPFEGLYTPLEPLRSVNAYGLFAVMTKERPEIVVEGSEDGLAWKPYVFPFKPGDLKTPSSFVAPHQPRLDWQMWFAALGTFEDNPWFARFLERLLDGSPPVLALLAQNPFPSHPPRYIRAELYRYHFASRERRAREATFWTREYVGPYSPVFRKEP
jgi:hypothetical protein